MRVSDLLTVLPLCFVMIAGPQIISAVFFATSERWAPDSLLYLAGAAISITAFASASFALGQGTKSAASSESSATKFIYVVILVLLVAAMLYTFLKRKESEPPKWMGKLQTASPRFAFTLGVLLLGVFPTDILTSVAVGQHLAAHDRPWGDILVFTGVTLFLLAIPAILVVLLGSRAKVLLPKVRDWMNANSWIISELVMLLFVAITANSLANA